MFSRNNSDDDLNFEDVLSLFENNTELSQSSNSDNFIFLNESEMSIYNKKSQSPNKNKYRNIYCVNCGEKGHVVKDCTGPITSFGIIAFKVVNDQKDESSDINNKLSDILSLCDIKNKSNKNDNVYPKIKFLMIQRKDTMGYTDFVRGKYPDDIQEAEKILPIFLNEMTKTEKNNLLTHSFDEIWKRLWVNHDSKCFKNEYEYAYRKYHKLDIKKLVQQSENLYHFTEFGFPKGRRCLKESNIACAEREFLEETAYNKSCYDFIKNYPTIQEEFIGTNGIRYRHIYYLVKIKNDAPPPKIDYKNKIQTGEVKNIGWFSFSECMAIIRPYDNAKKNVITKVYKDLLDMKNNYTCSNFYYSAKKNTYRSESNIKHINIRYNKSLPIVAKSL